MEDSRSWKLRDFVCNPGERCVHQRDVPTCICNELGIRVCEEAGVDGTAASKDPRPVVRHSVLGCELLGCGGGSVDLQIRVEPDEILHQRVGIRRACRRSQHQTPNQLSKCTYISNPIILRTRPSDIRHVSIPPRSKRSTVKFCERVAAKGHPAVPPPTMM